MKKRVATFHERWRENAIEVYRRRTDEEMNKKRSREREREREKEIREEERETRKKNLSTVNFIRNSLSLCLSVSLLP